jgi:hypothetical protein
MFVLKSLDRIQCNTEPKRFDDYVNTNIVENSVKNNTKSLDRIQCNTEPKRFDDYVNTNIVENSVKNNS